MKKPRSATSKKRSHGGRSKHSSKKGKMGKKAKNRAEYLEKLKAMIPQWRSRRAAFMQKWDFLGGLQGLCPLYTIDPLAPHWGEGVTFDVLPGSTFGTRPPGKVWLLAGPDPTNPTTKTELLPSLWDPLRIEVTLPTNQIAGGPPYWVQVPSENCEPRPISIFLLQSKRPDLGMAQQDSQCPLFYVTPVTAFWGDEIALRTSLSPIGFGTTPGQVNLIQVQASFVVGGLVFTPTGQSHALTVVSWGEAEIVVRLPASAPFVGPYRIRVPSSAARSACAPVGDPSLLINDRPVMIFRLTLIKLVCCETEDNTGKDECRLDVSVLEGGPSLRTDNKADLNDGETWELNWQFWVPVVVSLWDEDLGHWPDKHDLLGSHTFNLTAVEDSRVRFCDDGADYYLYYKVEEVVDPLWETLQRLAAGG